MKKMNLLQRGFSQAVASVAVATLWFILTPIIIDIFIKLNISSHFQRAQTKGLLTLEQLGAAQNILNSISWDVNFLIVSIGLACTLLSWKFLRWSLHRNWSWPVTLPEAVNLQWAMQQLGKDDRSEWIPFICKHNLKIFIAEEELSGNENNMDVWARYYKRSGNQDLVDYDFFFKQIGANKFCLSAADYSALLNKHGKRKDHAYASQIEQLQQTVTLMNADFSEQGTELSDTKNALKAAHEEIDKLRKASHQIARENGKNEKQSQKNIPFWRIGGPVINHLLAMGPKEGELIIPEIQKTFDEELAKHPSLQETIDSFYKLGEDGSKTLQDKYMNLLRDGLAPYVQREPGRKSPKKEQVTI